MNTNTKSSKSIKTKIISAMLLLLASVVWGAAFVAQSIAGESVGTFSFNGIRFLIGGLCMLPLLPKKDNESGGRFSLTHCMQ
jgi:drug/metabolite transporter (DMT)-like permease